MLELSDFQAEDFVADGVEVSQQLLSVFRLQILEQVLNVDFNVGLLVRVTVLLFLYVLHAGVSFTFLLPIELL